MEKWKREQLIPVLEQLREYLAELLMLRSGLGTDVYKRQQFSILNHCCQAPFFKKIRRTTFLAILVRGC